MSNKRSTSDVVKATNTEVLVTVVDGVTTNKKLIDEPTSKRVKYSNNNNNSNNNSNNNNNNTGTTNDNNNNAATRIQVTPTTEPPAVPTEPSGNKRSYTQRIVVDDECMDNIKRYCKRSRPSVLTYEEKLAILLVNASIRYNAHSKQKALFTRSCDASEVTSKLFCRSKSVTKKIWAEYVNNGHINEQSNRGNHTPKETRIPTTTSVVTAVQNFVREERMLRKRVMARHVLQFLVDQKLIDYSFSTPKSQKTALRTVQRWLKRLGYTRERNSTKGSIELSPTMAAKRDKYLLHMRANRNGENGSTKRIVYVGESYLYEKIKDTDKNVQGYLTFIGAFIGPNYNAKDDKLSERDQSHFLGELLDIEISKKAVSLSKNKKIKRRNNDSNVENGPELITATNSIVDATVVPQQQANTNTTANNDNNNVITNNQAATCSKSHFFKWFDSLCKYLNEDSSYGNVEIVLENSRYVSRSSQMPNSRWANADLIKYATQHNITLPKFKTKNIVWDCIVKQLKWVERMTEAESIAKKYGINVIYLPPWHANLNPARRIFRAIGKKLNGLPDVDCNALSNHLKTDLNTLSPEIIASEINFVVSEEERIIQQVMASDLALDRQNTAITIVDALEDDEDGSDEDMAVMIESYDD